MAPGPDNRAYRVRQLPSHLDIHHPPRLLTSLEKSLGPVRKYPHPLFSKELRWF
jgi:hypothetical protein